MPSLRFPGIGEERDGLGWPSRERDLWSFPHSTVRSSTPIGVGSVALGNHTRAFVDNLHISRQHASL